MILYFPVYISLTFGHYFSILTDCKFCYLFVLAHKVKSRVNIIDTKYSTHICVDKFEKSNFGAKINFTTCLSRSNI